VLPIFENLIRYVEPLSEARTPLADFFSILLGKESFVSAILQIASLLDKKEG